MKFLGICSLTQKLKDRQHGQSLVETVLILPILILMFFGVIEVGWALRGYLALVGTNREAVRFAVKNQVLDFSSTDPAAIGYEEVLSHTLDTLGTPPQLPLDFSGGPETNATIIMSHLVVDTGFPCVEYLGGQPILPYDFDEANCDCVNGDPSDPDGDGTPWFSRDDLVLHPAMPTHAHYAQTYGIAETTRVGKGSYQTEAQKLILDDNQLNCTVLQTGTLGERTANNMFIVEMFYDQPQLLGVPLISNQLTNPIPLYTHTAMRIVTSREADTHDTIGPVCELFPIAFDKQLFVDLGVTTDPDVVTDTVDITLFENGPGNDDFDWVSWNPTQNGNNNYLQESLDNPRLAINDFTDLSNGDTVLSTNEPDSVALHSAAAGAPIDNRLAGLKDRTIQVPVFDGANNIDHVAELQINQVITATRQIDAKFLGYNDQACQQ
jgi:Flp pilus assembly protein TadG